MPEPAFLPGRVAADEGDGLKNAELLSLLQQLHQQRQAAASASSLPPSNASTRGESRAQQPLGHHGESGTPGASVALLLQLMQQRQQQEQKQLLLRLSEGHPQLTERGERGADASLPPRHAGPVSPHLSHQGPLRASGFHDSHAPGLAERPLFSPEFRPRAAESQALKQLFASLPGGAPRQARDGRHGAAAASKEAAGAFVRRPAGAPLPPFDAADARGEEVLEAAGRPSSLPSAAEAAAAKSKQEGARNFPVASFLMRGLQASPGARDRDDQQGAGPAQLEDLLKLQMQQQQSHERLLRQQLDALAKPQGAHGGVSKGRNATQSASHATVPSRDGGPAVGAPQKKSQLALLQQHQALLQQQRQQVQQYLVEGAMAGAACARSQGPRGADSGSAASVADAFFQSQGGGGAFPGSADARGQRQAAAREKLSDEKVPFASSQARGGSSASPGPSSAALRALQQRLAATAAAGAAAAGGGLGVADVNSADQDAHLLSRLQQSVAVASYNLLRLSSPSGSTDATSAALKGLGETLGRLVAARNGRESLSEGAAGGRQDAAWPTRPAAGREGAGRQRSEASREGLEGGPHGDRLSLPSADSLDSEALHSGCSSAHASRAGASAASSRVFRFASGDEKPLSILMQPRHLPPPASASSAGASAVARAPLPSSAHERASPAALPSSSSAASGSAGGDPAATPATHPPEETAARERAAAAVAAARAAAVSAAVAEPPLDPTREKLLRRHVKALRPYFEAAFSMPGFLGGAPRGGGAGAGGAATKARDGCRKGAAAEEREGAPQSAARAGEDARAAEATADENGGTYQQDRGRRAFEGTVEESEQKLKETDESPETQARGEQGGGAGDQAKTSEIQPEAGLASHGDLAGETAKPDQKSRDAGRGGTGVNPAGCLRGESRRAPSASRGGGPSATVVLPLVRSLEDELAHVSRCASSSVAFAAGGAEGTDAPAEPKKPEDPSSLAPAAPAESQVGALRWQADASFLFFDAVQQLREECGLPLDPVVERLLTKHPRRTARGGKPPGPAGEVQAQAASASAGVERHAFGGEKEGAASQASGEGGASGAPQAQEKETAGRTQDALSHEECTASPQAAAAARAAVEAKQPKTDEAYAPGSHARKEGENTTAAGGPEGGGGPAACGDEPDVDSASAAPESVPAPDACKAGGCEAAAASADDGDGKKDSAGSETTLESDGAPEDLPVVWDGGPAATERWCGVFMAGWAADARQAAEEGTRAQHAGEELQREAREPAESPAGDAATAACAGTREASPQEGEGRRRDATAPWVETEKGGTESAWRRQQTAEERIGDATMPHLEIQRLPMEWPRSLASVCAKALQQPDAQRAHTPLVDGAWAAVWGVCRQLWAQDPMAASAKTGPARATEETDGDRGVLRDRNPGTMSVAEEDLETCLVCEALWAVADAFDSQGEEGEAPRKNRRPFRHFGGCPAYALFGGKFRDVTPTDAPARVLFTPLVPADPTALKEEKESEESAENAASLSSSGSPCDGLQALTPSTPRRETDNAEDAAAQDAQLRAELAAAPSDVGALKAEAESAQTPSAPAAEEGGASGATVNGSASVLDRRVKREGDSREEPGSEQSERQSKAAKEHALQAEEERKDAFWAARAHRAVPIDLWRPPLALLEERFIAEVEREVSQWRVADILERRRAREEAERDEVKALRTRLEILERMQQRADAADASSNAQSDEDAEDDELLAAELDRLFDAQVTDAADSGGAEVGSIAGATQERRSEHEGGEKAKERDAIHKRTRETGKARCVNACKGLFGESEKAAVRWIKRELGPHALLRVACGQPPFAAFVGRPAESVNDGEGGGNSGTCRLSLRFCAKAEEAWEVVSVVYDAARRAEELPTGEQRPRAGRESPAADAKPLGGAEPASGSADEIPTGEAAPQGADGAGEARALQRFPVSAHGYFLACRLAVEALQRDAGNGESAPAAGARARSAAGARSRKRKPDDGDGAQQRADALLEAEELRCLLAPHAEGAARASSFSSQAKWWAEFLAERDEEASAVAALASAPPLFSLAERVSEAEDDAPAPSEDEKPAEGRVLPLRSARSSRLHDRHNPPPGASAHVSRGGAASLAAASPATPQAELAKAAKEGVGSPSRTRSRAAAPPQAGRASESSLAAGKKIRVLVVGRNDVSDVTQDCRQWLLRRLRLAAGKRPGTAPAGVALGVPTEDALRRKRQREGDAGEAAESKEDGTSGSLRDAETESASAASDSLATSPGRQCEDGLEGRHAEARESGGEAARTWREALIHLGDGAKAEEVKHEDETRDDSTAPESEVRSSQEARGGDRLGAEEDWRRSGVSECAGAAAAAQFVPGGKRRRLHEAAAAAGVPLSLSSGGAARLLLERLCERRAHATGAGPHSGGERLLLRFSPEVSGACAALEEKEDANAEKDAQERSAAGAWSSEGEDAKGLRDRTDPQRHSANTYSLRYRRRRCYSPVSKPARQTPPHASGAAPSSSSVHASRQRAPGYLASQGAGAASQQSADTSPSSVSRNLNAFASFSALASPPLPHHLRNAARAFSAVARPAPGPSANFGAKPHPR